MTIKGGIPIKDARFCQSDYSVGGDKTSFPIFRSHYFNDLTILPGLVDVHVHFRQPGFSYKETIESGSMAAAVGGFTAVCTMPNLVPCPDCIDSLNAQLDIIKRDAVVRVVPYGCITKGQQGSVLADLEAIAPYVAGFSDDGRGVQDSGLMREAMAIAASLNKPIVAHCEDESLLTRGWAVNDGEFARSHGLIGNNPESEYRQLERDLNLVAQTGVRYHACHISTAESVALIREAKRSRLNVTCETAPHYLWFSDDMLLDEGRFRMNPPIRSIRDRDALIEGTCDGTVDVIATDHAPHSKEEKSRGLASSINGVVGLETSFAATYTLLVEGGYIGMQRLVELMSLNARRIFELGDYREKGEYTVVDLNAVQAVDSGKFVGKGKATPFDKMTLKGTVTATVIGSKAVYTNKAYKAHIESQT